MIEEYRVDIDLNQWKVYSVRYVQSGYVHISGKIFDWFVAKIY